MRCDTGGASGHVTIKPSICNGSVFYKFSVYAVNVSCLTPRSVNCSRKELKREQWRLTGWQKSTAGIVGGFSAPKAPTFVEVTAGEECTESLRPAACAASGEAGGGTMC